MEYKHLRKHLSPDELANIDKHLETLATNRNKIVGRNQSKKDIHDLYALEEICAMNCYTVNKSYAIETWPEFYPNEQQ